MSASFIESSLVWMGRFIVSGLIHCGFHHHYVHPGLIDIVTEMDSPPARVREDGPRAD